MLLARIRRVIDGQPAPLSCLYDYASHAVGSEIVEVWPTVLDAARLRRRSSIQRSGWKGIARHTAW
jgi:hypothetical protein